MRMFHKWLAIVTIPLVVEIGFVSVLLFFINKVEVEVANQLKSQQIKEVLQQLLQASDQMVFESAEYAVTRNFRQIDLMTHNTKKINALIDQVTEICDSTDQVQKQNIDRIRSYKKDYVSINQSIKSWVDSKRVDIPLSEQVMIMISLKEQLRTFSFAVRDLFTYRAALDREMHEELKVTRLCLRLWVAFGVIVNILVTVALAHFFGKDITRRIDELEDRSVRLAMGQELQRSSKADQADEIALLDKTFFEVATHLKDSLDRERANFDNAADPICALDQSGRIGRVNQAFRVELGYETSEVLQSHFVGYLDTAFKSEFRNLLKDVQDSSKRYEYNCTMVTAQGKSKYFLWSFIWDPGEKIYLCVGRDVTEYRMLERAKQDFIAMLSHDLRSPLTSIGATIDFVSSGAFGVISEKMATHLTRSKDSLKRLLSLINELLDLEKLEAGEMELKISLASVDRIMDSALDTVRSKAEQHHISLEANRSQLVIHVDEDRIIRVLLNLLFNAIKFSPANSVIKLEAIDNDKNVEIRVTDQGEGIAEEHHSQIFERYKQVSPDENKTKQGSGLGLAICKAIVDAHKGEIGVSSGVGQGTTFWLRIPKS